MLNKIKKFIPQSVFAVYHKTLALLANFIYRSPSDKLIVIGVTGTSGKSTVVYLIAKLLEGAGYKVGAASTIFFKIDKKEWLNDTKMSMVGRFFLQRLISQMTKANCQYALIETTSQGIEQFRHLGINYDILVFTNLHPEHIEAHGGFDNYKKAKLKLFSKLQTDQPKNIAGQEIKKTIIVNLDDEHHPDFLANWAQDKWGFTLTNQSSDQARVVRATDIKLTNQGAEFQIGSTPFRSKLLGPHNLANCLAALTVCLTQGINEIGLAKILAQINGIPGRLEFIEADQKFTVIVDYAFEPEAVAKLYQAVKLIKHRRLIHLLGSAGGGRDVSRRPKLGELAGQTADYVVVTNEDPYDEPPDQIIAAVADGAKAAGKILNQNLFTVSDRRDGIVKALSLAGSGDLVLITGKGSEQAIVVKNNKKISWDDRQVVKEELIKLRTPKPKSKTKN
ncbi:MAG: hypothetical protein A3A24_00190 [Candidatus Buchananbacteria bacterium RIFCSPLOWO2_01_FULL_46_12]|uniref:UDP-N-acetylmuramyl-tripeptide synthetase n=1 Tax=Candidatus Buchananbacteria bacterium RIFCSPLOWO2_01_FULL_46_12 TaxID=1797546 RepID=A0A1G1YUJ3_9BACT|nr:MAG: hypothetical protein A3A24_00190 [Candidatus Buchananbacteria bacterium RIFCSPLOWO2_01_FULL_46_12]